MFPNLECTNCCPPDCLGACMFGTNKVTSMQVVIAGMNNAGCLAAGGAGDCTAFNGTYILSPGNPFDGSPGAFNQCSYYYLFPNVPQICSTNHLGLGGLYDRGWNVLVGNIWTTKWSPPTPLGDRIYLTVVLYTTYLCNSCGYHSWELGLSTTAPIDCTTLDSAFTVPFRESIGSYNCGSAGTCHITLNY